ncbi:MAG: hypothetical protein COV91_03425 [Candidatus Taylorbacteria bacterium CG11_big_fil_rev_8_21_14_0_20_46_11]|uniref:Replication-relaxation n=1 Tax=Candidatus Taylorbacteria bacterium CG11_big_fil_rev_8_21_14_0_20_46_11 TaxID=1975025 RepID=A0A2H0KBB3_9BACT|nr:MAG: hypothetical protein COV91_03425 [Candidatus Taylorbacteria bacterium CG11_big_fil_rev_8_21_14_0_20_46_11]
MKQKRRIEFSKDDLKLFRYLHFFRAARIDQIRRDLFPQISVNTTYWRLKRLEKHDYLQGKYSRFHGNKKVLGITTKTFKEFLANGDEKRIEVNSKSVDHDLDLVDICRMIYSSQRIEQYISENELQTWQTYEENKNLKPALALNSDAVIKVTFDNGSFWLPLEYESNTKSSSRYRDLLYQLYNQLGLVAVLYVCKDKKVQNAIKKIEEKFHGKERPMIYYKLLDELKQSEGLIFTARNGKMINIGDKSDKEITSTIAPQLCGALYLPETT